MVFLYKSVDTNSVVAVKSNIQVVGEIPKLPNMSLFVMSGKEKIIKTKGINALIMLLQSWFPVMTFIPKFPQSLNSP